MSTLASVIGRGVVASRPAAGIAGQLYFATDVSGGTLQRDNGSTWDNVEGASTATVFSWVGKSANYTILTTDSGILVDTSGGAVTITLPTAVSATQRYAIKKKTSDANAVTINTTSAQTIDGYASGVLMLVNQNQSIEVESDGTNWYVAARSGPSVYSNVLVSNVPMATANTGYDGPSLTLPAGAYELKGRTMVFFGSSTYNVGAKLWDGTTEFDSISEAVASGVYSPLNLLAYVTLAATATVKITGYSSQASSTLLATTGLFSLGSNVSRLIATRVG